MIPFPRYRCWLALALILLVAIPSCQRAPKPPAFASVVDTLVPNAMAEFLIPGAAVGIISRGKVTWVRSFGVADVASGRKVDTLTTFNVGSLSKAVTAWGVMRLVADGRVNLDAPVDGYLSRWHLPPSSFDNAEVTTRRLLSHTAGINTPSVMPFGASDGLPSLVGILSGAQGSGIRVVAKPGTGFQYSGGGYDILQLLVEEQSGRPFARFLDSAVLHPLGMTHSAYGWPPAILAAAATPYNTLGQPAPAERFTEVAAAGLQTTIADLARLAAAELPSADSAAGRGVLPPSLVAEMQSPTTASPGWGLGHEVITDPSGVTFAGHNGANTGWRALLQVAPKTGDGIVILTNSGNGFPLIQRLTCAWELSVGGSGNSRYCDAPDVRYALYAPYLKGGVKALLATYDSLHRHAGTAYRFDAGRAVRVAYDLLHAGHAKDAVAVFEANVAQYPDDWNGHDSLGEGYLAVGDTARAIAEYRRSVRLNAGNENGKEMLRKLGG